MTRLKRYATYLRDNPVVLLDLVKYVAATLILFGLPIPPGVDVAVAGAVLAALTIVTRARVVEVGKHREAVTEALNTPAPAGDATAVLPVVDR